ncbi:MAG TPA: GyrI-like domain-containing protein [Candidatus Limnocylindrales bacterium]|jgi:effector-binding domain-containing protein
MTNVLHETEVLELQPRPTVAVRVQQPMAELDLASAFDRYMPLVRERIKAEGGTVAGPPFGRYHRYGPDEVDVEIGFPVTDLPGGLPPLASRPAGEPGTSELPGGPVARTVHRGSYDGLAGTYDALHTWIHAQDGFDDGDGPWESYVDSPLDVADPSAIRTEIYWPLVRT